MVRWESELIPTISSNKALLGDFDNVAFEIPSGYGIADVVFYSLDEDAIKNRLCDNRGPIDETNILKILLGLRTIASNDSVSITTLRQWMPNLKNDVLSYLIESGYLLQDKSGESEGYKPGVRYQNGLRQSVAIEAKLKDWKGGLFQAYRYRRYADKSYLAVYSKHINPPLKNLDQFKRYNVGLIEVTDDTLHVHFHPVKQNEADEFMKAVAYENLLAVRMSVSPTIEEAPSTVTI